MSLLSASTDVICHTTHGPIKGALKESIYGDSYYSFERIPFAQPPLGKLRFKAPVAVSPWTHVLDCTQQAVKPLQKNNYSPNNDIEGAEDCLYLNVYVKQLQSSKPLPIMVFLYGGGFEKGDPTRDLYGPDYFMMKNVILVTIAYRLGPFGFLSLADPALDVPGNAGLKDQLLALQWLAQNANNFNGDPGNITLFGESAGAASTHYLMLIPQARGLFHKAILMSGNVLCPWAISAVRDLPQRLAHQLGLAGAPTDKEILEFLCTHTGEQLLTPDLLTPKDRLNDTIFAFGPVVEPYPSVHSVLLKQPSELLATAWGNAIPLMLGGTSLEGLLMYGRVQQENYLVTALGDNVTNMLPTALQQAYDGPKRQKLGDLIKRTHFADNDVNMKHLLNYCEYVSYKVFWHSIWRTAQARLRYAHAPTYLYRFDFDSPTFNHQRIKYGGPKLRGVAHVDDRSYLFYGNYAWKLAPTTAEFKTIQRMIEIWTTFADTSNPNCHAIGTTIEGEAVWKSLTTNTAIQCLNISTELQIIDLPELPKLRIWDSLYEKVEN